jgi:hypothetical protein
LCPGEGWRFGGVGAPPDGVVVDEPAAPVGVGLPGIVNGPARGIAGGIASSSVIPIAVGQAGSGRLLTPVAIPVGSVGTSPVRTHSAGRSIATGPITSGAMPPASPAPSPAGGEVTNGGVSSAAGGALGASAGASPTAVLGQVQFHIQAHVQDKGVPWPALFVNVVVFPQNVNVHVQSQGALEPVSAGAGELVVALAVGPFDAVGGGERPLVVPCVGAGA